MSLIEIIPVHLVYSHSEYWLKFRINPFVYESFFQELVDIKAGCMAIIEDEWMPQRLRFLEVRFILLYEVK